MLLNEDGLNLLLVYSMYAKPQKAESVWYV